MASEFWQCSMVQRYFKKVQMHRYYAILIGLIVTSLPLTSCGPGQLLGPKLTMTLAPTATNTVTPTLTHTPTSTATLTATPTSTPTATSTSTATFTPTATPTATATPRLRPIPAPTGEASSLPPPKVGAEWNFWFLADGKTLALERCLEAKGFDCVSSETALVDTESWHPIGAPRTVAASPRSTALSSDGKLLAAGFCTQEVPRIGCIAAKIEIRDMASGKVVRTLTGHTGNVSLRFSPDGRWLASYSPYDTDWTVRLWDVKTGKMLWKATLRPSQVRFTNDSAYLFVAGTGERSYYLVKIEVASGTSETLVFDEKAPGLFVFGPQRIEANAGGQLMAVAYTEAKKLEIWRIHPKDRLSSVKVDIPQINNVFVASRDDLVAIGGCIKQDAANKCLTGGVIVWDVASGRQLATLNGPADMQSATVAFSPDSRSVLVHYLSHLEAWDTTTWERVGSLESCDDFAISPVGNDIVANNRGVLQRYSLEP